MNELILTKQNREEIKSLIKNNRKEFLSLIKEIPEELRLETLRNLDKILRGELI